MNPNYNHNYGYNDPFSNIQPTSNNIPYQNNNQKQFVSPSNDIPIINEITELNQQFCGIMKTRLNGLKNIATSYQRTEYEDAVVMASLCKDLGVVNDFFNYAFIKKDLNKIQLKSDQVIRIFPMIVTLCSNKHEDYFRTGINSAWTVLKLFYDVIREAKNTPTMGGVDLNREEKLKKYDTIINYFIQLRELEMVNLNLQKNNIKDLNLPQFIGELDHFLKSTTQQ